MTVHIIYICECGPDSRNDTSHHRLTIFEPKVRGNPHSIVPPGFKIRATFECGLETALRNRHTYKRSMPVNYAFDSMLHNAVSLHPAEGIHMATLKIEEFGEFEGDPVHGIVEGTNHVYAHGLPDKYKSSVVYAANTIAGSRDSMAPGEAEFFDFIRPLMQAKGYTF